MKYLISLTDITKIKRISFRQDINGLRGIAVMSVVLYHAEIGLFKGGYLGVDIFFVISGYLISNIIISELNDDTFSFKTFYIRRIKRILPALFSTLLLTVPFAYFLLTPKAMNEYIDSMFSSIFFYANYHFMNLDFYIAESAKLMPLLHTWSLAIEEQYYIIFPLFSYFLFKYFKKYFVIVIALISLFSIYLNTITDNSDKFYRLEFRIWELLLGVLIMTLSQNLKIKHLEKIGFPLMLFPIFYFDDDWINNIEPKLIALLGICFVIFSNHSNSGLTKFLSYKPLKLIGLSSYSIYLLHQPIFVFFRIFKNNYDLINLKIYDFPENLDIINMKYSSSKINLDNVFLINSTLIILCISLSFLFYKYIEMKLNNGYFVVVIFVIISTLLIAQVRTPYMYLSSNTELVSIPNETVFSDFSCWNKLASIEDDLKNLDECFIDNDQNRNLIVIGDSSSAAISKNIINNKLFNQYNQLHINLSHTAFFEDLKNTRSCDNCLRKFLNENKRNTSIVFSFELHRYIEEEGIYFTKEYSGESKETLKSNLVLLSNSSNYFILLEPFPTLPQTQPNPKDILRLSSINEANQIYIPLDEWVYNTKITRSFLNDFENEVNVLTTKELFCDLANKYCSVYDKKVLYYVDQVHLSSEGSQKIIDELSLLLSQ